MFSALLSFSTLLSAEEYILLLLVLLLTAVNLLKRFQFLGNNLTV